MKKVSVPVCKDCKNELRLDALKCVACGNYQDWRRYLGISTTVIAFAVAFFSLMIAATDFGYGLRKSFQDFLSAGSDEVTSTTISVSDSAIIVYLTNSGKNPVVLRGLSCLIYLPKSESSISNAFLRSRAEGKPFTEMSGDLFSGPYYLLYAPLEPEVIDPSASSEVLSVFKASQFSKNAPASVISDESSSCFISLEAESSRVISVGVPINLFTIENFDIAKILDRTAFIGMSEGDVAKIFQFHE